MQDDRSSRPHDTEPLSFAELAELDPILIKHSPLRSWEFPKVSREIDRRFSEAIGEQIRRALRKTHPHLSLDEDSMVRKHAETVAASLATIMSPERLIQVISAKGQDAKRNIVDNLMREIRDHLAWTAVYIEFPPRPGPKRSEGNEERDEKILELRERDGLSFGKIAVRLRLGPKGRYVASSAYRRVAEYRNYFISQVYPELREIGARLGIRFVEDNTLD